MAKTVLAMTSLNSDGDEALETYLAVVGPLMESAGAKQISRYQVSENLSGTELPQFVSIIEYPDEGAVQSVFNSPEYIALKPIRDKAFDRYDLCVISQPLR